MLGLIAVVLLIATTGFFVAAEFALVAIDRSRLEQQAQSGSRRAVVALSVVRRLSFHLSGAQLGVTLSSLVLGFVAEPTLVRAFRGPVTALIGGGAAETVSVIVALTVATVGSMLLGELIPKGLVLARPMRATLYLAGPLRIFSVVFGPLIAFANGVANRIVRLFGVEPREELTAARSPEELQALVRASGEGGGLHSEEVTLLSRSLRFGTKTAEDAMVPRRDVVYLPRDATVADLTKVAIDTGHSRFPVIGTDLDEVVGVVHAKDVFRLAPAHRATASVESLMSPLVAVPEYRPLSKLLGDLQGRGTHLALVVDEYGGTAGIITVEDLLEEIVGEIADEYDAPDVSLTALGPGGSMNLSGGLRPDEVADSVGFHMPEGPYATLAGFVLHRLGHIPAEGEWFSEQGWLLRVSGMDRHRIETVGILGPDAVDEPTEESDTGDKGAGT